MSVNPVEALPDVEYTIPIGVASADGGVPSVDEAFQQILIANTWTNTQSNLESTWSVASGSGGNATFLLAAYEIQESPTVGWPSGEVSLVAQDVHTQSVTSTANSEGTLRISMPLQATQQLLVVLRVEACDSTCTDVSWRTKIAPGTTLVTTLSQLPIVGEGDYCTSMTPETATPYAMQVNTDSAIMVQRVDRTGCADPCKGTHDVVTATCAEATEPACPAGTHRHPEGVHPGGTSCHANGSGEQPQFTWSNPPQVCTQFLLAGIDVVCTAATTHIALVAHSSCLGDEENWHMDCILWNTAGGGSGYMGRGHSNYVPEDNTPHVQFQGSNFCSWPENLNGWEGCGWTQDHLAWHEPSPVNTGVWDCEHKHRADAIVLGTNLWAGQQAITDRAVSCYMY